MHKLTVHNKIKKTHLTNIWGFISFSFISLILLFLESFGSLLWYFYGAFWSFWSLTITFCVPQKEESGMGLERHEVEEMMTECSVLPEPFPWHLNPTELISRSQNLLHCLSISLFLMHLLFIQPFSHRRTSYCQNTGANKAHSFPRWLCVTAWSGISLTFTPLRGTEGPWRPAVSLLTLPNRVRPENCLDPAQPASCTRGLARTVCSADILTFISEQ